MHRIVPEPVLAAPPAAQPEPQQAAQQQAVPQQPVIRKSVSEPAGQDFSADTSTQGRIAVGRSAKGDIATAGDVDWFAVTLEKGNIYRFGLEGAPTGKGSLNDPYLRGIYDADGHYIADTADHGSGKRGWSMFHGWNAVTVFTPTESGTYYVAAASDAFTSRQTGIYKLSVKKYAAQEPPAQLTSVSEAEGQNFPKKASTPGQVVVGESVTGKVDKWDDRDWFAVTLEAGKTYRFDLEGSSTGNLDATRRETANGDDPPEHGMMLRANIRW